jgi:hypothetical protein
VTVCPFFPSPRGVASLTACHELLRVSGNTLFRWLFGFRSLFLGIPGQKLQSVSFYVHCQNCRSTDHVLAVASPKSAKEGFKIQKKAF